MIINAYFKSIDYLVEIGIVLMHFCSSDKLQMYADCSDDLQ